MTTIHGCLTKTVKYNAATASKMAAALSSMARRAKTQLHPLSGDVALTYVRSSW